MVEIALLGAVGTGTNVTIEASEIPLARNEERRTR